MLYRTIHSREHDHEIMEKTVHLEPDGTQCLIIDFYNIIILIIESLQGHKVYRGSDGYTRDLAKVFGRSRKPMEEINKVLYTLYDFLSRIPLEKILFIADKQVSHSKEHLKNAARIMKSLNIETVLTDQTDKTILELARKEKCVIATGDTVILEKAGRTTDLAYQVLIRNKMMNNIMEVWALPFHYSLI